MTELPSGYDVIKLTNGSEIIFSTGDISKIGDIPLADPNYTAIVVPIRGSFKTEYSGVQGVVLNNLRYTSYAISKQVGAINNLRGYELDSNIDIYSSGVEARRHEEEKKYKVFPAGSFMHVDLEKTENEGYYKRLGIARHIIFLVTMELGDDLRNKTDSDTVTKAVKGALVGMHQIDQAQSLGLKDIVFPAIGTGVFGLSMNRFGAGLAKGLADYQSEVGTANTNLRLHNILYNPTERETQSLMLGFLGSAKERGIWNPKS